LNDAQSRNAPLLIGRLILARRLLPWRSVLLGLRILLPWIGLCGVLCVNKRRNPKHGDGQNRRDSAAEHISVAGAVTR
jgi:hypothetical protein